MKKQFPSAKNIPGKVSPNAERLRNQHQTGSLKELIVNTSPSNSKREEDEDNDYWPTTDKKLSPTKKKMPMHASNMKLSSRKMKIPHDMTDLDVDLIEYGHEVGNSDYYSGYSPNRRSPNMKNSRSIPILKRMNSGQRYTSTKKLQAMNESLESLMVYTKKKREEQMLNFVKPGHIYDIEDRYRAPEIRHQLPEQVLDASDFVKRFQFEQLKTKKLEAMCQWKQADTKGTRKTAYIKSMQNKNKPLLQIALKSNIEQLEIYTDRFPFLQMRKSALRTYYNIKAVCHYIISTPTFDNISIAVILANSVTMVFDDTERSDNPNPIFAVLENVYLILYTIEMVFKILGLGFIFGEDTYIWDPWNLLDFFIVMSSYAAMATVEEEQISRKDQPGPEQSGSAFNVKGLRVFRVMRPLKTVNNIKGLKVLILAVLSALPLLQDTLLILFFFFLIFAIAGTQTFSGMLKQRCVSIQTGLVHGDDLICGKDFGGEGCPGGFYCAKANESPNYGVTNFDNIFYSLLAIFQCVTLEGWSEIQRDMQKCFADVIWIFFIPLVLGGAFFLLNLTLAVINSKFTEAHNRQADQDMITAQKNKQLNDDDEADEITAKESMTISQFINARIYAKKMIQFLRMRQKLKADREEKQYDKQFKEMNLIASKRNQIENKVGQHLQKMMRKHMHVKKPDNSAIKMNPTPFSLPTPPISNTSQNRNGQSKVENMVIVEDAEEQKDDHDDDQDKLDQDIAEFLQEAKIELKRQAIPVKSKEPGTFSKPKTSVSDGPKMMGNIGVIKDPLKKLHRDNIGDLNIDKVLANDSKDQQSLDMQNYDITSQNTFNIGYEVDHLAQTLNPQEFKKFDPNDYKHVPGIEEINSSNRDGGLISSDSDFEQAVYDLGIQSPRQRTVMNQNNDASKQIFPFFKKMLTANHNSSMNLNSKYGDDPLGASTQFIDGSSLNSNHIEIESKFQKKSQKLKKFAEDSMLDDDYKIKFKTENKKTKTFEKSETIDTQKPQDNFIKLDPLTEKVVIGAGFDYHGTSQNEVILPRLQQRDKMALVNSNKYVQLPFHQQDKEDPDFISRVNQKNIWKPYQQKFNFRADADSSELSKSHSDNEDDLQNQEQPWETPQRVAFREQTMQVFTKEIAKRSDIMITSTLSMSLNPKDKRDLSNIDRTKMSPQELTEFIDEKNAFRSMSQEYFYENRHVKEKDKPFKDVYSKSVFFNAMYQSKTLAQFRQDVQILNNNQKKVIKKSKAITAAEDLKHKQNVTASERRGMPKFTKEMAQQLLDGEYHEEDEDEQELTEQTRNNGETQMYTKSYQEKQHEEQLDRFEMQLRNIFAQEEDNKYQDEVPLELKHEFGLPMRLGDYEINFKQIRKFDASKKKISPVWSGQQVLPDVLDEQKSIKIVSLMNKHRVWPIGFQGLLKRARYVVRLHVKSPEYDDFFTFVVLLNSVTMALNSYGMTQEREEFLELSNTYFTWIFIYEMYVKILGIGIKKYLADGMNWLDGFIVQVSIFELVYPLITGGAENSSVKALKTLRLLRTIRVVRIVRLLRSLESMKVIISVVKKSYMSFVYITCLMFLFIFIFTLLGMSIFAGYFQGDPEGSPSNNYDSFLMAFFTIFQVLTMENWQTVLYNTMRNNETKIKPFGTCILYIAWIFIGNFILLNLFLAILLDSFLEGDDEDIDQDEVELALKMKKARKLEKLRRRSTHKVNMDMREIKKMRAPSKFLFGQLKTNQEEDLEDLEDLDEDQIIQILKDMKIIAKDKREKQEMKLFENIDCASSFYLFSKENQFRIISYKLMKHQFWEWSVLFLIMLSSLKLAIDTYSIEVTEDTPFIAASKQVDFVFNILFIIEMVVKLISMGLVMDDGAYLRDGWNQMDFFIVMTSIIDMSLDGLEIKFIKILRMLRALRPLRFLSSNVQLKLIVNALISSLGGLFNVLIVLLVVFLIYAIVGVSLYAGKFFYCSDDPYQLHTQQECEFAGGKWLVWDHNFDNAMRGLISLYVVSSLEGWPDIMLQAIDITDVDLGPKKENRKGHMFFFVIFILIGSFFFLNFFIGVLFMKFGAAQAEEQKGYTSQDLAWMDIQRLILEAQPDYETTNVPKSKWRQKFHSLTSSDQFEGIIMIFILLNMLQMAVAFESQSSSYTGFLEGSNYVFTIVFIIEAVLKLIAYGTTYFQTGWNKFDFFVVSASIFDFLLEKALSGGGGDTLGFLSVGPQIARVMRVLRVTRILRLAGKAKGLQAILETIKFSLPALMNVFILLILVFFMASVLSNFTFYKITEGEVLDPNFKNFRNFKASLLLNFALSTGEDWNKVMFDCSRSKEEGCIEGKTCGTNFSFIYFVLLILICSHVMLNLFILVIIQQFEKYYLAEDNMLGQFKNDFIAFMKVWRLLTQERYKCFKIKEKQILSFFRELGRISESLGFSEERYDEAEMKKNLLRMSIKSDNGYVYFNEMLYRCMRRKYGNMKINKKMQVFELRTQFNIYMKTQRSLNKKQTKISNEDIFNGIIKKENGVNPFLTVMYFKITFKTWLKVARRDLENEAKAPAALTKPHHHLENDNCTENQKLIQVDIDVEEIHEYTSEEDDVDTKSSLSQGESETKESIKPQFTMRQQRNKNHMKKFQKQMQIKLEEHVRNKLNDHIFRKMTSHSNTKQSPKYAEDTPIMHLLRSSQEKAKINQVGIN